jgi:hypothetical protein
LVAQGLKGQAGFCCRKSKREAMVSVCKICRGLQKSQRMPEGGASGALHWFSTTLPVLRRSATAGCRGCALILQGVLLHHDRFVGLNEDRLKISAESFVPGPDRQSVQSHLSVELRWKSREDAEADAPELDYEEKYPDLKLEFYAEKGMLSCYSSTSSSESRESLMHGPGSPLSPCFWVSLCKGDVSTLLLF